MHGWCPSIEDERMQQKIPAGEEVAMKTLVIIFLGLMVHVNQPFSLDNTVVIPRVEHHVPELRIPENAVLNPQDPWVKQFHHDPEDEYVIPLRGRKFRIAGTRGMFSDKHSTFFAAAPRLGQLAQRCELRDEVRNRQITAELVSYIDYRAGRLTVESYFPRMLEFESGPLAGKHCVACKTRYEADLRGDRAQLVFADGHVVVIAGNSAIEVDNLPEPGETSTGHFSRAYTIFKDGCEGPRAYPSGQCKNTPVCRFQVEPPFPDADCTNTNYP
jgi:prepilin-type processing-associated H-X9-DG protein